MSFVVYCHTNVQNDKKYVGWTSFTIEERWQGHIIESVKPVTRHRLFYNAMRKYGTSDDTWRHEILAQIDSEEEAKELEKHWIAKLHTNACQDGHGYNMINGGDGVSGRKHSQETKDKIRNSLKGNSCGAGNKGRVWTDEQRDQISKTLTGRKRPPEECQKITEALKKRWATKKQNENSLP